MFLSFLCVMMLLLFVNQMNDCGCSCVYSMGNYLLLFISLDVCIQVSFSFL